MANLFRTISRMSIRARVAFGLVCTEQAFRQFGLGVEMIERLLGRLWRYTEAEELSWWGCAADVDELAKTFGENISRKRLELMSRILSELDEIGGGNLFAGFKDEFTLTPALNLAALLEEQGIALPPAEPFVRISPRRLWNAWGHPFARAELEKLVSTLAP